MQIGPYQIGAVLGRGATATVYAAVDPRAPDAGSRALKLLHEEHRGHLELVVRFFNERALADRVQHPGLARVFDAGYHQERPYLLMERLDRCLAERQLTRAEVCQAVGQVAEAMAALHRAGVVHRDLSPRNILLAPAPAGQVGRAKVTDLGLAKVLGGAPLPVSTALTEVLGAMEYRAPEAWLSAKDVDERADVYSLGVVLFERLAGALPFSAERESALMELHLYQPPPPLLVGAGVDAALARLVDRMLAKQRKRRPTMDEIAAFFSAPR